MAVIHRASGLAARLAAIIASRRTPEDVLAHRLDLARRLVERLGQAEPMRAALVVGSTALRRCSPRADLDLVLIADDQGDRPRFENRDIEDVHVEIERLTSAEALSMTGGKGWTWELRSSARLGCGVPVLDPQGLAARLRDRAAAQQPDMDQCEEILRGVYSQLAALGGRVVPGRTGGEALRGVLDNLVLLALMVRPRRFQKAKWALADLLHAGRTALVDATLTAYGVKRDAAAAARAATRRTTDLVDALYREIGAPSHADLLAMGYAPEFLDASYVSRTLGDAEDLSASGRHLEAQYVAKFAARLAAALASPPRFSGSLAAALQSRDAALAALYAKVFADAPAPTRGHLRTALASTDALLAELGRRLEPAPIAAPA